MVCAVSSIACNVIGQKPNSKLKKSEQRKPRFHGKGLFRLVTHFCVGSKPLFWLLIQDCIYPFVWVGNSKLRKAKRNGLRGFVRVVVGFAGRSAVKRNSKRNGVRLALCGVFRGGIVGFVGFVIVSHYRRIQASTSAGAFWGGAGASPVVGVMPASASSLCRASRVGSSSSRV